MDQRTDALDQDVKDILHTRMAIATKLDALEQRVLHRVEDATMQVTHVLDRTTRHMNNLVDKTRTAVDPSRQVQAHPWLMVGGAFFAGCALGLLERRRQRPGVYPYYPPGVNGSRIMPGPAALRQPKEAAGVYEFYPGEHRSHAQSMTHRPSTLWDSLSREFQQETGEAKQVMLQLGHSFFDEFTKRLIPEIARTFGLPIPSTGSPGGRSSAGSGHAKECER
ncbi:MAG: hypothetical protein JSR62_10185 [Nitrospira sp.]|nr:hypothetical protein [Nitrospira sp.]